MLPVVIALHHFGGTHLEQAHGKVAEEEEKQRVMVLC